MATKDFMRIHLPVLVLFFFTTFESSYAEITGKAETVPESGFIQLKGKLLSLKGIQIISHNALCFDSNGQWSCGKFAWKALKNKLDSGPLSCKIDTKQQNNKMYPDHANCQLKKENLNIWLIIKGWALTNKNNENFLTNKENIARLNNEGIWRDGFIPPDLWRTSNNNNSKNCNICSIRRQSFMNKKSGN